MYKLYTVTFDLAHSTGNVWIIKAESAKEALVIARAAVPYDTIEGSAVKEIELKNRPQIIKFIPGVSDV